MKRIKGRVANGMRLVAIHVGLVLWSGWAKLKGSGTAVPRDLQPDPVLPYPSSGFFF